VGKGLGARPSTGSEDAMEVEETGEKKEESIGEDC